MIREWIYKKAGDALLWIADLLSSDDDAPDAPPDADGLTYRVPATINDFLEGP